MRVTIDKAGRVVIPKKVRDELGLVAGMELELEREGSKVSIEAPVRRLRSYRKNGVLVFTTDAGPLTVEMVNKTIEDMHAERDRQILGNLE